MTRFAPLGAMTRGLGRAVLVTTIVGLALSACGGDPSAVYRDAAASTLESTLSEGRSAELAGRLWLDGRLPRPAAVVVVRGSAAGVGADAAWFEDQQPPRTADDPLRQRTTDAVDAAASAVDTVRTALERSDRAATASAVEKLRLACAEVEALAEVLP